MEKFELEKESSHPPVPVPYQFLTPKVKNFVIFLIRYCSFSSGQAGVVIVFFSVSNLGHRVGFETF